MLRLFRHLGPSGLARRGRRCRGLGLEYEGRAGVSEYQSVGLPERSTLRTTRRGMWSRQSRHRMGVAYLPWTKTLTARSSRVVEPPALLPTPRATPETRTESSISTPSPCRVAAGHKPGDHVWRLAGRSPPASRRPYWDGTRESLPLGTVQRSRAVNRPLPLEGTEPSLLVVNVAVLRTVPVLASRLCDFGRT